MLPYDSLKDLTGVSPLARGHSVLVVNSRTPVQSVKDLVALAKAQPGKLNFEQWSKLFLIDDPVVALASPEQQERVRALDNIINNYLPG